MREAVSIPNHPELDRKTEKALANPVPENRIARSATAAAWQEKKRWL